MSQRMQRPYHTCLSPPKCPSVSVPAWARQVSSTRTSNIQNMLTSTVSANMSLAFGYASSNSSVMHTKYKMMPTIKPKASRTHGTTNQQRTHSDTHLSAQSTNGRTTISVHQAGQLPPLNHSKTCILRHVRVAFAASVKLPRVFQARPARSSRPSTHTSQQLQRRSGERHHLLVSASPPPPCPLHECQVIHLKTYHHAKRRPHAWTSPPRRMTQCSDHHRQAQRAGPRGGRGRLLSSRGIPPTFVTFVLTSLRHCNNIRRCTCHHSTIVTPSAI